MSPVPIYREGENFFVPVFLVTLDGTKLKAGILRDVLSVTYKDSVSDTGPSSAGGGDSLDSFEMTINNWDADARRFKYEPHSRSEFKEVFDPGRELTLSMGYFNNSRIMLRGQITSLEPSFTESGPATLSVRGLNVLHKFRKRQHTWAWPETKKDSDIAVELGRQRETPERPGLGMTVEINERAKNDEPSEFVFMNNQYDIAFLLERARRRGYALHLNKRPNGEEYLYFGPSDEIRRVTYELEWGRSLVSFRPTLTTANQVESVTVRGWDRANETIIEGTARIPGDCLLNNDQTAVARAVHGREEVVTNQPVRNADEAKELAKNILCNFRRDVIRGSGATVGLPDLRAGNRVVIKGLGPRFNGSYFVTSSTHTIDSNGYRTTFESRREGPAEGGA